MIFLANGGTLSELELRVLYVCVYTRQNLKTKNMIEVRLGIL